MSKLNAAGNPAGWNQPSAQLIRAEVDRLSVVSLSSQECAVALVPVVMPG
jgi:hypothetical protein